ncbi:MAG: hypothetical protein HY329_27660 [Chloroflexi bacterium]|nr:hypothetical protein [Chloroflexota bacterium]
MHFDSATQGYAWLVRRGHQAIAKTTDAGANWRQVYPAISPMSTEYFDREQGLGFGSVLNAGAILRTFDGGASWEGVGSLPPEFQRPRFIDLVHGWAIAPAEIGDQARSGNALFRTTDGGATWTRVATSPPDPGDSFTVVFPFDANRLVVATNRSYLCGHQ